MSKKDVQSESADAAPVGEMAEDQAMREQQQADRSRNFAASCGFVAIFGLVALIGGIVIALGFYHRVMEWSFTF